MDKAQGETRRGSTQSPTIRDEAQLAFRSSAFRSTQMFGHTLKLIPLLLAISCAKPAIKVLPVPIGKVSNERAKVSFQPAPPPFPSSAPPIVSEVRVSVRMIISSQGEVIQIQPIEGEEPFLSTVARYARKWRFEPSGVEYRQAVLTMIYGKGNTISLKIA